MTLYAKNVYNLIQFHFAILLEIILEIGLITVLFVMGFFYTIIIVFICFTRSHSLTFSNQFVMIRVTVDLKPFLGRLGVKQEYTLDGMPGFLFVLV